ALALSTEACTVISGVPDICAPCGSGSDTYTSRLGSAWSGLATRYWPCVGLVLLWLRHDTEQARRTLPLSTNDCPCRSDRAGEPPSVPGWSPPGAPSCSRTSCAAGC